jgi:hypothetical protein
MKYEFDRSALKKRKIKRTRISDTVRSVLRIEMCLECRCADSCVSSAGLGAVTADPRVVWGVAKEDSDRGWSVLKLEEPQLSLVEIAIVGLERVLGGERDVAFSAVVDNERRLGSGMSMVGNVLEWNA